MTISINSLIGHIIATTIVSLLTLGSFFVLYQLLSGFYCRKSRVALSTPQTSKEQAPSVPTSIASSDDTQNNELRSVSDQTEEPIQVFFKRNTIAVCIIWSIICIACAMDRITLLANPHRAFDPYQYIIFPFYFIGRMLLSLIFIGRLHYTFNDTSFGYSKCTMNILKITWLMMALSALLAIGLSSASSTRVVGIAFSTLVLLIDILLSFVLLYLYGRKLYVLMSANDAFLLAVMTKYSLLYTVCFVSTFCMFLAVIIQAVTVASNVAVRAEDIIILVAADALVNSVCLWLNLKFADRWYHTWCKWGDSQCMKCCKAWAHDAIAMNEVMMKKDVVSDAALHVQNTKPVRRSMNITVQSSQTGNQAIIL